MKHRIAVALILGFFVLAPMPRDVLRAQKSEPSFGLPTGQKAPAFVARDQFGHEQTNDSLKGPNGTILLFFRSADW